MNEDNSTRLAKAYNGDIMQIIRIGNYLWKHCNNNGNWFEAAVYVSEFSIH